MHTSMAEKEDNLQGNPTHDEYSKTARPDSDDDSLHKVAWNWRQVLATISLSMLWVGKLQHQKTG
jgi:hypothetical protein